MSGQLPDDKDELVKSHLIISPSTMDMKSKYYLILLTRGSVQVRVRRPALVPDVGGFRHTEGIIQIYHDILSMKCYWALRRRESGHLDGHKNQGRCD